jgi:hypothetical protein
MKYNKHSNEAVFGKGGENIVKEYFLDKGYNVEFHVSYDKEGEETFQYTVIDNQTLIHPDFTIKKNKDNLTIVKMVEVKSLASAYKNYRPEQFPDIETGKEYATIHTYQFDDYAELARLTEVETNVIFTVGNSYNKWYNGNIWDLYNSKMKRIDIYQPKEYGEYYMWEIQKLLFFKWIKA